MKLIQFIAVAAVGLALPSLAHSQGVNRVDTTVRLDRQGTVDLSLITGRIRVTAWDRQEVKISAGSGGAQRLRFDATPSRVTLTIEDEHGRGQRYSSSATYDVSVPRDAHLNLEAVDGHITSTGTQGEIDASSVSGNVEVSGGTRAVNVESVSGSVRASQVNGDLRAESVSGNVRADGVIGSVEASSVSGIIQLLGIQSRDVRSETVSGNISYTGTVDAGGKYDFESHSGNLRLTIPRAAGAHVSVETFSGDVDTDFPVVIPSSERTKRSGSFEFTIGDGRARISAATFSGRIIISNKESAPTPRRDNE